MKLIAGERFRLHYTEKAVVPADFPDRNYSRTGCVPLYG